MQDASQRRRRSAVWKLCILAVFCRELISGALEISSLQRTDLVLLGISGTMYKNILELSLQHSGALSQIGILAFECRHQISLHSKHPF